MIFVIKKCITSLLLPQGLIIVSFLIFAFFSKKKLRLFAFALAGLIYLVSIEPVADFLLKPLENAYRHPSLSDIRNSNVYIVLGGGALENTPDMDGKGTLGPSSLSRVITAYRLYGKDPKPIIISSGRILNRGSEAAIAKRLLISFGIPENMIIEETKSMDTFENAQYSKEIADKYRLHKIVLITSAFHMKRSNMLFRRHFKEIVPYPADYQSSRGSYNILSFLPEAGSWNTVSMAVREYLGIAFYVMRGFEITPS